jgi:alpha-beta hydrolase superfamily lysophospholipase
MTALSTRRSAGPTWPDDGLTWADDGLLDGFVAARVPAVAPAPGRPAASRAAGRPDPVLTLVRRPVPDETARGIVVHLHGYNDYFFHDHLARAVEDRGWAFVAVDARRAGRSWRADEVPHYQDDLREQASDLGTAVRAARAMHPGVPLVVHAHSTGALVAALWAHAHRERGGPDGLVLNGPFFAVQRALPFATDAGLHALARRAPLAVVSRQPSWYARTLLASGRWTFDTTLKRPEGIPARAGWWSAVRAGQARVARGLAISCPVLVAHSATCGPDTPGNPDLDRQDTVVDVRTVARLAPGLGARVTVRPVVNAVHDLSLSADGPRSIYLRLLADALARAEPGAR